MPSAVVTGITILHMVLGAGLAFILNKLFSIDTAKTFVVYFILLSWYYLHKLETIYVALNNAYKSLTKEQVNESKSNSTP